MAPLVIRFVSGNSNESLDRATQTIVRSHAMSEVRRRQRRQKALEKESYRRQQAQKDPIGSLCTCLSALQQPQSQSLPVPTKHRNKVPSQRIEEHVADTYKICLTCGKVQFFDLSATGQSEFFKRQCPSITAFVAEEFDPFGCMAIPDLALSQRDSQELNRIKAHAITFCSPGPIKSVVFPEAMRTPALCMSMLYMTYAYLASVRGWSHQALALAMKTAAIREINAQLADPDTASRTATIASIAYLSTGTWAFGAGAEEVSIHKAGMELLVEQRGIESFSDFPFEQTIRKYLVMYWHHTIICGMLVISTSKTFRYTFPTPTTQRPPNTQNIQESPFYCPTGAFAYIARSKQCSKETLQVLHSAKNLTDLLLNQEILTTSEFNSKLRPISRHLLNLPHNVSSHSPSDFIYTSTLLAALITLEATSSYFSLTSTAPSLCLKLISALEKTDIGNCWGDMKGVLYWVSLTGSAASQGRDGCRMLDSTLGRSMFAMAFANAGTEEEEEFEAAIIPARVFGKVQEILRARERMKKRERSEGKGSDVRNVDESTCQ